MYAIPLFMNAYRVGEQAPLQVSQCLLTCWHTHNRCAGLAQDLPTLEAVCCAAPHNFCSNPPLAPAPPFPDQGMEGAAALAVSRWRGWPLSIGCLKSLMDWSPLQPSLSLMDWSQVCTGTYRGLLPWQFPSPLCMESQSHFWKGLQ